MGCSGSKDSDHGSTQQQQKQQAMYAVPQQMIPPSTLPQGWISQFDPSKQRLYYVYPQTGQVTWAHPLGPQADAQEMARFHQIQQQQQQVYASNPHQGSFSDNYNRQGGMGAGAGLAMGMVAGGAMGLMAGSMLAGDMTNDIIPASTDIIPTSTDFGGGDFGGGDEYVSADFGF
ncbi:hypothetical protein BGX27_009408 [Mortierella sp. AM989]|nr:hypothetical protein BGX27_009408 [Mortierella sp. AM989]